VGRIYETAIKIAGKLTGTLPADALRAAGSLAQLRKQAAALRKEQERVGGARRAVDAHAATAAAVEGAKRRYDAAVEAANRLAAVEGAAGVEASAADRRARHAAVLEVKAAQREIDRARKATERNAAAVKRAGIDVAQLAAEEQRLGAAVLATDRKLRLGEVGARHFGQTIEAVRKRAGAYSTVEGSFGRVGASVRSVADDAVKLAAGATLATGAVGALVLRVLHTGDEIGDTADKLGVGTSALQELRYAAEQSGAEVGSLDAGLRKLAINVGKAAAAKRKGGGFSGEVGGLQFLGGGGGSAQTVDPFAAAGLSARTLAKLKPEEQLQRIADAMAKLKTRDERAAFVTATLGKGATELLPLLEQGSAGIAQMMAQAHRYGGVLTPAQVAAADQADKAMRDAKLAIGGVAATLGGALLPVATRTFRTLSQWVADNRDKIRAWAERFAGFLEGKAIPALVKLLPVVERAGERFAGWLSTASRLVGGVENLGGALVALRLAPTAVSVGSLAVNFGRLAFQIRQAQAASRALAAASAAQGGAGAAQATGAAASIAGSAVAIKAALAAPTLGAAIASGGALVVGGMVAAAGGIGALIGTGIRKVLDTDELLGGKGGALDRLFGAATPDEEQETERLNNYARVEGGKRRQRDALEAGPRPRPPSDSTRPELNLTVNLPGGKTAPEDLTRALKAASPELLAAVQRLLTQSERDRRRLSYG